MGDYMRLRIGDWGFVGNWHIDRDILAQFENVKIYKTPIRWRLPGGDRSRKKPAAVP